MNAIADDIIPANRQASARSGGGTAKGRRRRKSGLGTWAFGLVVATLIYWGWKNRDAGYMTPEHGTGYILGIVGGVMMLLLLLYPLRKKNLPLLRWGPIRYWFVVHMMFGILGPVTILYHAGFKLGAVNSNVALFAMLVVAGSGLVGRYFYTRIHYGLYGARSSLAGLQKRITDARSGFSKLFAAAPAADEALKRLERWLLRERSALVRLATLPLAALRCWYVRRRVTRLLRRRLAQHAKKAGWKGYQLRRAQRATARFVANYVENLRRVAEIGTYERLFSWWHVLHLPLFIMMILAGVVHVIAVHMY